MRIRIIAAVLAAIGVLPIAAGGAPAATEPGQQSLSTTSRVSLTILPSATIGRDPTRRDNAFYARSYDGRDLTTSEVQIVFRDARGERVLKNVQEIERAVRSAQRAGDDAVDVTFVL